jgi:hypothetical protein
MKPPSVDYSQFGNYSDSAKQAIEGGANIQDVQSAYQKIQQAQPTQQQGNWLTRLLPTVGGVLGGIGGALIPGLGETGVSEIAGSGVGQGIGKGLENILTGNPWSQGVGSNVAQGAAFGGIGKLAGGVLGQTGKALGNFGTNSLESLSKEEQAAAQSLLKNQTQKAVELNYADVPEKYAKANNALTHVDYMNKAGLPGYNPYKMQELGQAGHQTIGENINAALDTQAPMSVNGWLQSAVKKLGLEPDIQVSAGMQPIKFPATGDASLALTTKSPLYDAMKLWEQDPYIKKLGLTQQNLIDGQIPLSAVNRLSSYVGKAADGYESQIAKGGGNVSSLQTTKNDLNELKASLDKQLTSPSIDKSIENFNLSREQMDKNIQQFGTKAGGDLNDGINNAKNLAGAKAAYAKYVQMDNVSDKAITGIEGSLGKNTSARVKASTGEEGNIANPGIALPGQKPANDLTSHVINVIKTSLTGGPVSKTAGILNLIHKTGMTPKMAEKTGSLLSKISKVAPAATVGAGGLVSAGAQTQPVGGSMQNQSMQQGMQGQGQNQLATLLSTLTAQEQASPINFASSLGPVISQLAPLVQKQNVGAGIAGNLAGAYQNAGGAQGPIGGAITNLSSIIPGTAANTYQRQQQATASTLAQLLGISPQQAMQLLPQITQSAGTATPMMNNVQGLLGSYGG